MKNSKIKIENDALNSKIPASKKVLRSPRRRGAGFVNDRAFGARLIDKSEPRTAQKAAGLFGIAPQNFFRAGFLNSKSHNDGFTLVELLVSIFIAGLLTVIINSFARDTFFYSTTLSDSMSAQFDARHVVNNMANELREAAPSALGAFPLTLAGDNSLTFYADINNDGLEEQISYFVSGTNLQQSVIVPTGSPLSYNPANQTTGTLISGLVSSSTQPIFQYYPNTYAGTSSPLTQPVDVSTVTLVKITVIIDKNINHAPSQIVATSQVNLRNLKSNQ